MIDEKNHNQLQIPNNFSKKFGNHSFAFFRELLTPDNTKWIVSNIQIILEKNPEIEEGKMIYEIAELIKSQVVEEGLEKLSDLQSAYVDIICEAVYSADVYEIAKEVYQQYRAFNKVEA